MAALDLSKGCSFIKESTAYSGVVKIADKVKSDISLVTDYIPDSYSVGDICENLVIYGTVDKSEYLKELESKKIINLTYIRNKWEVYGFWVIGNPLPGVSNGIVIAGSDKRGTIYGLFHLSELIGISPLVNWNHVMPKKKTVILTDANNMISKEPSVKYRGFFINDEWPAFGNWALNHFGGINADCYERVFELLLRLKGNYLWPAMWQSNFSMDGPGLESAKLADEYGVVMSTSHHEPCMRAGEEYNLLKGENSIYGNEWNFRKNEEGITRFWRDGLIRNREFENVITMGMRGERDSAILGKDAGLKANVDLLRDVLKTQNRLIRETINEDLDKVPRQIVLFTEVEEFFYGNKETKGLMGDEELEGVTLMLSDNNFGYTRTLPTEEMRNHKGGYGMYYHMDMHGGAHSYQWIGSTYLPRVWEQMTQAYEYGVREIWVTNIGDIGTQEYGLSFFLDLAYDMEKWGGTDCEITKDYTCAWVRKQFGSAFSAEDLCTIDGMMWDYTSLLAKRKHEIMNADIYHPLHFGEAQAILDVSERLIRQAEELKKKCDEKNRSSFISLLYYPVCGTANLMKMWILAGRNKLFASQNRIETNRLGKEIKECVKLDKEYITEYEEVDGEYYKGFGDSPHIGFTNWNDEDCKYPVIHTIFPAQEPRMLLSRAFDENYMTGQYWCDTPQTWDDFLRPDVSEVVFDISNGSDKPFLFKIIAECDLLSFSKTEGKVFEKESITLNVDKAKVKKSETLKFTVYAFADELMSESIAEALVTVCVDSSVDEYVTGTFVEHDGYISINADHFVKCNDVPAGGFKILKPYGRTGAAVKVFPSTVDFAAVKERPSLEYQFATKQEGLYFLKFYLSPTTPVCFESRQYLGFSVNNGEMQTVNTVKNEEVPFFLSEQWEEEAKNCIKIIDCTISLRKGLNQIKFYGMSPGIILEKIVIYAKDTILPESYLGPSESYCVTDN